MRFIYLISAAVLISGSVAGQAPARGPVASYTAAQAAQGKAAYDQNCASCHGANLDDGQFAPALRGQAFLRQWGGRPAFSLFTFMRNTMPPGSSGRIGDAAYAGILAYLLQLNGVAAGPRELPTDLTQLQAMNLPGTAARGGGPGGGLSPYATLPAAPARSNPFAKFTPVTDAMLAESACRRLAYLAPHLRRPRLQPAQADRQK